MRQGPEGAGGEGLDAGAGDAGQRLEVEGGQGLAAGQLGLDQVAADAPGFALGEFDLGEDGEEARRGPALLVGAFGEPGPVAVDAGQAQRGQHGGQRVDVHGAGVGGGHGRTSSRASKLASVVSATGVSAGNDRRRGSRRVLRALASGRRSAAGRVCPARRGPPFGHRDPRRTGPQRPAPAPHPPLGESGQHGCRRRTGWLSLITGRPPRGGVDRNHVLMQVSFVGQTPAAGTLTDCC